MHRTADAVLDLSLFVSLVGERNFGGRLRSNSLPGYTIVTCRQSLLVAITGTVDLTRAKINLITRHLK